MLKALAVGLMLAQTPVLYFNINTPITAQFQHTGNDGMGGVAKFRLNCDGAVVYNWTDAQILAGKSATADASGLYTYTLTYAGFATFGMKNCNVTAYSPLAESLPSSVIQIPIAVPPTQPINLKINFTVTASIK